MKVNWAERRRTTTTSAKSPVNASRNLPAFFPSSLLPTVKTAARATYVRRSFSQRLFVKIAAKLFTLPGCAAISPPKPQMENFAAEKSNQPPMAPTAAIAIMINAPQMESQSSLLHKSRNLNFSVTTTSPCLLLFSIRVQSLFVCLFNYIWRGVSIPKRKSPFESILPNKSQRFRRAFLTSSSLFRIGEF